MLDVARWPENDRTSLLQEASNRRGLSFDVIQKDFWVCVVLNTLFDNAVIGPSLYFKGGTSLSKCFHIIERFSEDIDLTIAPGALGFSDGYLYEAESPTQMKKRRKSLRDEAFKYVSTTVLSALHSSLSGLLVDSDSWSLDDRGDGCITFQFPADQSLTAASYIRPEVRLEIGGLSDREPSEKVQVVSYAAEELPSSFRQPATEVQTVAAVRTLCDKLLLLHRLNTTKRHVPAEQSRHFYDVAMLARSSIHRDLLGDPSLLRRAIAHEETTFPRKGMDYQGLKPTELVLSPPESLIPSLREDYEAMEEMFFSSPPALDTIVAQLASLEKELRTSWSGSSR